MSENDKPIFPRSSETDEPEQLRLYLEAKQKLSSLYELLPAEEKKHWRDTHYEIFEVIASKQKELDINFEILNKLNPATEEDYEFERKTHRQILDLLSEIGDLETDLQTVLYCSNCGFESDLKKRITNCEFCGTNLDSATTTPPIVTESRMPAYGPPPMDIIDEQSIVMPKIVACTRCSARFAEGVKFCGRCGNLEFEMIS